ncbi:MAG: hypothetical protein ACM3MK_04200 [Chitinophagales bacterium]
MKWSALDLHEKIDTYISIMERISTYKNNYLSQAQQEDLQISFFQNLALEKITDFMQRTIFQRIYLLFFEEWLLLDYRPDKRNNTIAENVLKDLDHSLSHAEYTALRNLISSCIAPYWVKSLKGKYFRMENLLYPKDSTQVLYKNFPDFVTGDVVVTRLLPVDKSSYLQEPWLLLMPYNVKQLEDTLIASLTEKGYNRKNSEEYCKNHAPAFLGRINQALIDTEQEVITIVEQTPFAPSWHEYCDIDAVRTREVLNNHDSFVPLSTDSSRFLYIGNSSENLTWCYLILDEHRLLLASCPGEDPTGVAITLGNELSLNLKPLNGDPTECNISLIEDFSQYLAARPEMIDALLLPKKFPGHPITQTRADFFTYLSIQLGRKTAT